MREDVLLALNVRYVINATVDCASHFEEARLCNGATIKYHRVPVQDTWHQNITEYFDDAFRFIAEAHANGSAVLVHCRAGISRSPTVVLAYLMQREGMSLNDAYTVLKRVRPCVSPNLDFMGQLVQYEQTLRSLAPGTFAAAPTHPVPTNANAKTNTNAITNTNADTNKANTKTNKPGSTAPSPMTTLYDSTNASTARTIKQRTASPQSQRAGGAGQAGFRLSLTLPQRSHTSHPEIFSWRMHNPPAQPLASPEAIQHAMRLPSVTEQDMAALVCPPRRFSSTTSTTPQCCTPPAMMHSPAILSPVSLTSSPVLAAGF